MHALSETRISVTSHPTFREMYIASLALIRYQGWLMLLHCFFPAFGLFLVFTPLLGYRLSWKEIGLAVMCFSFTPVIVGLGVWFGGRNELARGPFTYVFDSEGMHASGPAFNQTIRWRGIIRLRRSKRFLFIFVTPVRAIVIPLREINDPMRLEELCNGFLATKVSGA